MSASAYNLSSVLEAIQHADIPATERRRLGARAVEAALRLPAACGGHTEHGPPVVEPRLHLEEALVAVQEAAQYVEKLNVGQAKAWLRGHGPAGKSLACRLGRLSKARNATSHQDGSLIREIRRLHLHEEAIPCQSSTCGSAASEQAGTSIAESSDETGSLDHRGVDKDYSHDNTGTCHPGKQPTEQRQQPAPVPCDAAAAGTTATATTASPTTAGTTAAATTASPTTAGTTAVATTASPTTAGTADAAATATPTTAVTKAAATTASPETAGTADAATTASSSGNYEAGADRSAPGLEGTASLRKRCRDRILDIYSVYNPWQLQEVPDMLAKFKDQDHTLYLMVCSKIKIQPEPMLMSVPGPMNGRAVATAVMPPQSP